VWPIIQVRGALYCNSVAKIVAITKVHPVLSDDVVSFEVCRRLTFIKCVQSRAANNDFRVADSSELHLV